MIFSGKWLLFLSVGAVFFGHSSNGKTEDGVTDKKISVGASLSMSGLQKWSGQEVVQGTKAFVSRVNKEGGIYGRSLEYTPLDDGWDPKKGIKNTRELLEEDKVFAILTPEGPPSVIASQPMISKAGVPEVGPICGVESIYFPPISNLFNVRAPLTTQARDLIKLAKTQGYKRIALFRAEDSMGLSARLALTKSTHEYGLEFVGEGIASTNSILEIDSAIKTLQKMNPDVVVLWGQTEASGHFVKRAKELSFKPAFYSSSASFSQGAFLKIAGESADDVIVAGAVPFYKDETTETARKFNQDMKSLNFTPDPKAYEAYINATIFFEGLKRAGKDLTRKKFITALNNLHDFKVAGVSVSFSEQNHGALTQAFPFQYRGGKYYVLREDGKFDGPGL